MFGIWLIISLLPFYSLKHRLEIGLSDLNLVNYISEFGYSFLNMHYNDTNQLKNKMDPHRIDIVVPIIYPQF